MLFNCWEFKIDNQIDSDSCRNARKTQIFTEIAEDVLRQIILERTDKEWRSLYIRRTVIMSFNVCFVLVCALGIIISSVQKNELVQFVNEFAEENTWAPKQAVTYAELSPQVVLSVCNALIPIAVKLSTKAEKWDYQKEMVN